MGLENILYGFKGNFKRTLISSAFLGSLLIGCGSDGPTQPPPPPNPPPRPPTQPQNHPPVINYSPKTQCDENSFYEDIIHATDPNGDPLSYSVEGLSWLSVSHNIVYGNCPEVSRKTSFPVKIKVSDGKLSAEQSYNLTVKNLFNTYVLTTNDINNLLQVTPNTLAFSQPTSFFPGDVIGAGISSKTPHGLLRQVEAATGDGKTLYTFNPSLEQIIKKASFSFSKSLSPQNIQSINGLQGVSPFTTTNLSGFNFCVNLNNVVLYDRDGKQNTKDDQVIANGEICFNTGFSFDIDIDDFTLKYLKFQNKTKEVADITIGSNLLGIAAKKEVKITEFKFSPFVIGYLPTLIPIPLVVTPKIEVNIGIDPTQVNPLGVRVMQEADLEAWLAYQGSWSIGKNFTNNFDFSIFNPTINGDLKVYAGPKLEMLLYDIAGPVAGANGKLRLSHQADCEWKLYGGFEAYIGIIMELFSKKIAAHSEKVFDYEEPLAEKCGTTPPPPTTGEKILFTSTRDGNAEVYMMSPDGSSQQNLTRHLAHDYEASWSPDKSKIVFVSERDGNPEIYTMKLDGTDLKRLTLSSGNSNNIDRYPGWSSNGQEIVFYSTRNGNDELFLMNADGTNQRKVNISFGSHGQPKWCGNQIVFSSTLSGGNGGLEIYKVNRDGTGLQRLTNNPAVDTEPSCSKDGTKVSFISNRAGSSYDILVMNADGSNPTNLSNTTGDDYWPSWSPDGTKIAYTFGSIGRTASDIYVMNADGSNKTRITTRVSGSNNDPVWSP